MVKDEPVSLIRQTIYALIPILDLYAAYKIEKFRWYFVIVLAVAIPVSIATEALIPFPFNLAIEIPVELAVSVYLIRRWSKEWNKKFESGSTESEETK